MTNLCSAGLLSELSSSIQTLQAFRRELYTFPLGDLKRKLFDDFISEKKNFHPTAERCFFALNRIAFTCKLLGPLMGESTYDTTA
jgi:hypothetical protein